MTRLALLLVGFAVAALPLAAQTDSPRFEVASVKKQAALAVPSGPPSGAAPALTATFRRANATVVNLIRTAYNVTDAQVVGGPDWVRKDLFEINARAAGAVSLNGMRPMVASLLAERFSLILHREQRAMRGALLVMAREDRRGGLNLSKCEDPNAPPPPSTPVRVPVQGLPIMERCQPMARLAAIASSVMGVPVVDRTDLDGLWSYRFFYLDPTPIPEGRLRDIAEAENTPPFPSALNAELGLRLQDSNGPFEVIVIDSVEQPTPN